LAQENPAYLIDGKVYCRNCAENVAAGMIAFCFANGYTTKAEYYQSIRKNLEHSIQMEDLRKAAEARVDEVVEIEDHDRMKKLYRNRDGSMETKPLYEKIKNKILQNDQKALEPKPKVGYGS
jgi:hypothetical protein